MNQWMKKQEVRHKISNKEEMTIRPGHLKLACNDRLVQTDSSQDISKHLIWFCLYIFDCYS